MNQQVLLQAMVPADYVSALRGAAESRQWMSVSIRYHRGH